MTHGNLLSVAVPTHRFVFFMLVWMFFGREQFLLDHEGAAYQSRALIPLCRRFTPLQEVLSFAISTKVVGSESRQTQPQLEMLTAGRSLRFLQGGNLQELQWLQWQLNEHLELLKQAVAYATAGESDATPREPPPPPLAPGEAKALEPAVTPVAPLATAAGLSASPS